MPASVARAMRAIAGNTSASVCATTISSACKNARDRGCASNDLLKSIMTMKESGDGGDGCGNIAIDYFAQNRECRMACINKRRHPFLRPHSGVRL
jgi:hypothetical protein